ncbi:unnamed protein product, partial [Medioppia subpectinata]
VRTWSTGALNVAHTLVLIADVLSYSQEEGDFELRLEGEEESNNLDELSRRKRQSRKYGCRSDRDCDRREECSYVGYSLRKACQPKGRLIG